LYDGRRKSVVALKNEDKQVACPVAPPPSRYHAMGERNRRRPKEDRETGDGRLMDPMTGKTACSTGRRAKFFQYREPEILLGRHRKFTIRQNGHEVRFRSCHAHDVNRYRPYWADGHRFNVKDPDRPWAYWVSQWLCEAVWFVPNGEEDVVFRTARAAARGAVEMLLTDGYLAKDVKVVDEPELVEQELDSRTPERPDISSATPYPRP
jgi:hypothetical protein